jgi:hypothetical protein
MMDRDGILDTFEKINIMVGFILWASPLMMEL